ncbi:MAG: hypothetical protein E7680_06100 [Ruminococcaceae bacterium]|nr:hypothetical protein [Oscillospiraceae bacterium]
MELECFRTGTVVKEDYRILAKCEIEFQIPKEYTKVGIFYQKMAEAGIRWSEEILFENAKKEYSELPDLWSKSRFLPYRFRLCGGPIYENTDYFAVVCESTLSHGNERTVRRSAQVWNSREQTILPNNLTLRLFGKQKITRKKGFRPDGCYFLNGNLILFRNPDSKTPFMEHKIPISKTEK